MKWLLEPLKESWNWIAASEARGLELMLPGALSPQVQRHRARVLVERARFVASLFAVLTPLWILPDLILLPWPLWGWLALMRLGATLVFAALAYPWRSERTMFFARTLLIGLMLLPAAFFLLSSRLFSQTELTGFAAILERGYTLLPFVIVAGLSVFPLSALEVLLFSSPTVIAVIWVAWVEFAPFKVADALGTLWLVGLIVGVASFSCLSQLHYMIALVRKASHDALTGVLTRGSGEEIIDLQFHLAERHKSPLAVAFIDIDNFKAINDRFGHETGDRILRQTAESLSSGLRRGDSLMRWGGEEFVVLMVNTDAVGARRAVQRLRAHGLGDRPDGAPLTASVGVAERIVDNIIDARHLVEKADMRMYVAKQSGKNRVILCGEEELT